MVALYRSPQPFIGAVQTHPMRSSMERYHRRWWPGWTRVVDDGCGLVENFCRTLEAAHQAVIDRPQAWGFIVNDDMRPVPGLVKALPYILRQSPTPLVSFFSFRYVADTRCLERGERFRIRKPGELIYTSALAFDSCGLDLGIDEIVERVRASRGKHDDAIFTELVDAYNMQVSTHIPCLVQHTHPADSLVGNPPTIMGRDRTTETFPEGLNIKEVLERYPYD